MTNRAGIASTALLLFWTALILAADLVYGITTWRQSQSSAFAQTTGKIAQIGLGQGPLGRRGLRMRYSYTLNGVNYTGNRYRYDDANVSLRYLRVLDDFPAHSRHTVYYNPNNPRDSVLAPGVDGFDLLLFLVAMPFNVATFALWKLFLTFNRTKAKPAEADRIAILREKDKSFVRIVETSIFETAIYTLGLASAISAAVVIAVWAFEESVHVMIAVWSAVLVSAIAAAYWKHVRINSGRYDLRIETDSLTLPQIAAQTAPSTIPRSALKGTIVLRRVSVTPGGDYYSYLPALCFAADAAPTQTAALVNWGWTEQRADSFVRWLSDKLDSEYLGIHDEESARSTERRSPLEPPHPVPVTGHFGL